MKVPTDTSPQLQCHVISNTHWDREWRYPFQTYRMDLVDMMDRLLDILETQPAYRAYYLDSQTVMLEDYLEIRPENENRIRKLVKADRLQIGPWYTLPDEWGCHGEALVRNLLMGHRVAKRFGPVSKTGYTPFSNGQISQLPQLYRGFGIDSCFFYRGIGKHLAKSEFIWEGADRSRVFGFRFGDYARYNYYYLVYRPGLLGRFAKDRDYIWNPDEIPYKVAVAQSADRQYRWMNQKLKVHPGNLMQAADDARRFTEADATTRHLLYMMGHDHSFAAREEIPLIDALRKELGDGREIIFHSSLNDYMKAFRKEARVRSVVRGEMRHTLKEGLWTTLMATILSCRLYLKQQNCRVNSMIINAAEPLAAMAWLSGSEYPARHLEIAWKKLLVNHAHDAIGGCSVDQVHTEMQARWSEVEAISDELCRRSMRDLICRIDGSAIPPSDLQLTVFNTLAFERAGVAEFIIDLPSAAADESFAVETLDGHDVPVQIISSELYKPTIEGGYELSMSFDVRRHVSKLFLENLPPMGYKAFAIRRGRQPVAMAGPVVTTARSIENEFLCVDSHRDGTFRLTNKLTGRVSDNLCVFDDTAEFGDPWNRIVPPGDHPVMPVSGHAPSPRIRVIERGPLSGTIEVAFTMMLPAEKGGDGARSGREVETPIRVLVNLTKSSLVLNVTIILENRAKDHRLRVLFPSCLPAATHSIAEGQFDVLRRPIKLPDATGWKEQPYPTHPMWNFVEVNDDHDGFAVINDGLTEYEVMDDDNRTIAITLMRCFGKFQYDRPTPGSQCLGIHTFRFALYPHSGKCEESRIFEETAKHITAPLALESAPTRGEYPVSRAYMTTTPGVLVFGGIKQGEDGKTLVLRLWNPRDNKQRVTLHTGFAIRRADQLTLEEKKKKRLSVDETGSVHLSVASKEIVSVGLLP
ncbi:MAG: hypothetical protein NTY46_16170 [Candidatus Sumerlaeota bacterium]|nr:hypothetical protein [Candidatus Sumerlaeota bacterium]